MEMRAYALGVWAVILLFSGMSWAQDGGMVNGKGKWTLDAGYAYQDVDMDLTKSNQVNNIKGWNGNFDVTYERDVYFVGASYGVCRWADLRFSVGFVDDYFKADGDDAMGFNDLVNEGDGWFWEIGFNSVLHKLRSGYYIGAMASYSQWDAGDESFDIKNTTPDPTDYETEWEQWTGALYVGKTWGNFSPWAGLEYTVLDITQNYNQEVSGVTYAREHEYENEDEWGGVVGLTYWVNPQFELKASGRFVNQTAFSFGASYGF